MIKTFGDLSDDPAYLIWEDGRIEERVYNKMVNSQGCLPCYDVEEHMLNLMPLERKESFAKIPQGIVVADKVFVDFYEDVRRFRTGR